MKDYQQLMKDYWHKVRAENPIYIVWAGVALACLFYYLIVLTPLSYATNEMKDSIATDRTQALSMTKMTQEILRLRQALPHQRVKTTASAFTLVNQSINSQGWNKLVTDVHQVDQTKVQVNFSGIAYNELMLWLEKVFDQYGIYVVESTLTRSQPGVVDATLILQQTA